MKTKEEIIAYIENAEWGDVFKKHLQAKRNMSLENYISFMDDFGILECVIICAFSGERKDVNSWANISEEYQKWFNTETTMKELDIRALHEQGKKFKTINGRDVRIICTDRKSDSGYNVVALIDEGNMEETLFYTNKGSYWNDRIVNELDLVLIPEKITKYAYIGADTNEVVTYLFDTKEEAIKNKPKFHDFNAKLVEVTWEE